LFPKCSRLYVHKTRTFQSIFLKIIFFTEGLRDSYQKPRKRGLAGGEAELLVFWEQRLVVLATPKAGSTAIATALESLAVLTVRRPEALKHTTVHGYQAQVRPWLEAAAGAPFTTVALMRAPREWLGSWYRFLQKPEQADGPRSTLGLSFDEFVQGWCADAPPVYADFGTQADFLSPGVGPGGLDHLFRYEDMAGFVQFLEQRLDCEIILPQVNVSPAASLALSPATEARMWAKAAADQALYASLSARAHQG
jgi:hypothetical protein